VVVVLVRKETQAELHRTGQVDEWLIYRTCHQLVPAWRAGGGESANIAPRGCCLEIGDLKGGQPKEHLLMSAIRYPWVVKGLVPTTPCFLILRVTLVMVAVSGRPAVLK
jgi:hypothetical protein